MISWLEYKGTMPALTGVVRITDSGEGDLLWGGGFARAAMSYFESRDENGYTSSGSDSGARTFTTRTGPLYEDTRTTVESGSNSWSTSWDGRPLTAELKTSTTAIYSNEWGDTWEAYKILTCESTTESSHWTTKTTTGATGTITQFTTTTQNATILTTSNQTEPYTVKTITVTRTSLENLARQIFDTIVEADEGEVLYVVSKDDLTFWQPSNTPFLTEIAATSTRITLKWRPAQTTVMPTYVESVSYPNGGGYGGETAVTQSYRRTSFSYNPQTVTSTFYSGVVPTPTTTAINYGLQTTTSDTYIEGVLGGWPYDGRFNSTVVHYKQGKVPVIIAGGAAGFLGWDGLLTFDEIIVTNYESELAAGNGYNPAIIATGPPQPPGPPSNRGETREANMLVDIDVGPRYGLLVGGGGVADYGIPDNTARSVGLAAYKAGVMTSPSSYYGELKLSNKTLLIATVLSTGTIWGQNWVRETTTATTTTSINSSSTATTYATRTTTFSPTYARFHRSNGGIALLPTSGDSTAYTANVSAVTYTSGPASSTTTASQILSATGSGVTRLSTASLIGGAAGFEETIYGHLFGLVKINGSKTFFSNNTDFSSTTTSSGLASHIEFPAIVLTAETYAEHAGPFFWVGGWSYLDILND